MNQTAKEQQMRSSKKQFIKTDQIGIQQSPLIGGQQSKKSQSPGKEKKNVNRLKTGTHTHGTQSLVTLPKINSAFTAPDLNYLPSRFNAREKVKPITFHPKEVLGDLEGRIQELQNKYNQTSDQTNIIQKSQELSTLQPSAFRITQPHEFKKKPLCRKDHDFLMFKEIFVAPSEQKLTQLQVQEQEFDDLFHKGTQVQYDKILNIYDQEKQRKNKGMKKLDEDLQNTLNQQVGFNATLQDEFQLKQTQNVKLSPRKEVQQLLKENFAMLEQNFQLDQTHPAQEYFFDQQIAIQPPDLPNATIASPLTPGNGYAPSLPLTQNFKENQSSIKDLLVRAQAGMQAGDIQKEAHLSFYLGMVYQSNQSYKEAIQFYTKFFTCARMMEDKLGMSIGTNRVAINYFNMGKYEKSIEYHKQNIQLSDIENTFGGYFNLGISFRKCKQFNDSLVYFNKALQWARQRDELESQCITYGQLGVTYFQIGSYQKSTDQFTTCYQLAQQIRNTQLQLDCLMFITQITGYTTLSTSEDTIQVLHDAIECARILDDQKTSNICICNLGVLEGLRSYNETIRNFNFYPEIEDDDEDDDAELQNIKEEEEVMPQNRQDITSIMLDGRQEEN